MTQSLLKRIQEDALAARKARNTLKGTLLTTVLAEAAMVGKNDGNRESTDAEVEAIMKKFYKNNEESISALWTRQKLDTDAERAARRTQLQLEQAYLRDYLPKQARPDEIKAAVREVVAAMPNATIKQVGVIMGQLNARFAGNFDKALASQLVRDALQATA